MVDLLPTIIDIAGGLEKDLFSFDGQSLLKPLDSKRPVFSEYFAEGSIGPRFMIKTPDRKFIYSEVTLCKRVLPSPPSKKNVFSIVGCKTSEIECMCLVPICILS